MLIDVMELIYVENKSLFPPEIVSNIGKNGEIKDELASWYSCFRSFRRTSDSRALEKRNKLEPEDAEIVNRWRSLETSKGRKPHRSMKHHYADVQVIFQPFLRYTKAM